MENADVVEQFYGVYLLFCANPKYLGRVYIGYTVDPNRRIKQHNKGKKHGGAWKTSNKGPWVMVMIVHGFPNDISALRFEWAWQHPESSRRLQHITKKAKKENKYEFSLRILSEMLLVGPWNRLPLTIRWLDDKYIKDLPKSPPFHMPICYGPVISKKIPHNSTSSQIDNLAHSQHSWRNVCYLCKDLVNNEMRCLNPTCDFVAHILCLSRIFVRAGEYLPVEGSCPCCKQVYLWGDLVRKYKGCYNNADLMIATHAADDFYCSDSE